MTRHRKPRIFHGLFNISGIPGSMARVERAHGYHSRAICFPDGHFKRSIDQTIEELSPGLFLNAVKEYDIFNFHFGYSFFGQNLKDIRLLKMMGKKIFMHFHGCDIRDSKYVLQKYPINACMECWPMLCSENRALARRVAATQADRVFVSTPDLVEFVPGAIWLPQLVDIDEIDAIIADEKPYSSKPGGRITIAHAPTATNMKGSRFVEEAISDLQKRGYEVELKLLTGMSHAEVIKAMYRADIVIDQLLNGAYGVVSIEAMALRKPTVCFIREDLMTVYGNELPIWSASVHDLSERLVALIENKSRWREIGEKSRQYVENTHAAEAVFARMARHDQG